MRRVLIFSVLLTMSLISVGQKYKVIHVNGQIQAVSTKKMLDRGSSFGEKEKFSYITQDARAIVVDSDAGKRLILQKPQSGDASLAANLTPSMGNISSRSGSLLNRLDVKNHFSGKYVIINELKISLNPQVFPQNDSQFFYISYIYKGESINKKLMHKADTLVINKDSLLKVDGKPILNEDITDMKLSYYSKVNGVVTTALISDSFFPVFPDTTILKSEIELLLSALPADFQGSKLNMANDFISDAYGKTNYENVKQWYLSHFTDE